jgi:hypothetical protein
LAPPGREFSDEQRRALCIHEAVQLAGGTGSVRCICCAGADWIDLANLCGRVVVAGPAPGRWCPMSVTNVTAGESVQKTPARRVSIRPDGEDFVIVSLAENVVVYRNPDARALRKLCHSLRWEIAIDSSLCRWLPTCNLATGNALTAMTSTTQEKAFLRVAVAAIPRVTELIQRFSPDDQAGALETAERSFRAAALDYGCTEIAAQSRASALMRRLRSRLERQRADEKKLRVLLHKLTKSG